MHLFLNDKVIGYYFIEHNLKMIYFGPRSSLTLEGPVVFLGLNYTKNEESQFHVT